MIGQRCWLSSKSLTYIYSERFDKSIGDGLADMLENLNTLLYLPLDTAMNEQPTSSNAASPVLVYRHHIRANLFLGNRPR